MDANLESCEMGYKPPAIDTIAQIIETDHSLRLVVTILIGLLVQFNEVIFEPFPYVLA